MRKTHCSEFFSFLFISKAGTVKGVLFLDIATQQIFAEFLVLGRLWNYNRSAKHDLTSKILWSARRVVLRNASGRVGWWEIL
jgi:hypothetical protein